MPEFKDPRLLVGSNTMDDAGVYKLSPDTALISTLDFFTPIVDDPYTFGQIAAANALSDVYSMGGTPLTAMNILCFPCGTGYTDILAEVLRGGAEKIREAGVLLVGGHSVEDEEPKYGLSVTGIVHPDKVITNASAREGDKLILTKPLGTGVLTSALKGEVLLEIDLQPAVAAMATLNKVAGEVMQETGVSAATDITGFGFLGHAFEMARAGNKSLQIKAAALPLLPRALEVAEMGILPAGLYNNRNYLGDNIEISPEVPPALADLMYDPQTSGGLLISVPPCREKMLLERLKAKGVRAATVGEVLEKRPAAIYVEL